MSRAMLRECHSYVISERSGENWVSQYSITATHWIYDARND